MKREYKSAMDSIKADEEFKKQLLETLQNEPSPARRTPMHSLKLPLTAAVASAAAVALLAYASFTVVLPLLQKDNEYNDSRASTDRYFAGVTHAPDALEQSAGANEDASKQQNLVAQQPSDTTKASDMNEAGTGKAQAADKDAHTTAGEPDNYVVRQHPLRMGDAVTVYDGEDLQVTEPFSFVARIRISGFERFGISSYDTEIVFDTKPDHDYSLHDLLEEYYDEISRGRDGFLCRNGMIDRFCGIDTTNRDSINVYFNEFEIVNLDNTLLADFYDTDEATFIIRFM